MDIAKRRAQLSKMSAKAFQGVVESAGLTYTSGKRGTMIDAILVKEFPADPPTVADGSEPTITNQATGEQKTEDVPQSVNPASITVDDVQVETDPEMTKLDEPVPGPELTAVPAAASDGLLELPPTVPKQTKPKKASKPKPKPTKSKEAKPAKEEKPASAAEKPAVKGRRGRRPLSEVLTPEEKKSEIKELLDQLSKSTSTDEKKSLRRALRLRGHQGGMGLITKAPAK